VPITGYNKFHFFTDQPHTAYKKLQWHAVLFDFDRRTPKHASDVPCQCSQADRFGTTERNRLVEERSRLAYMLLNGPDLSEVLP
jgi:hypothetical protein